MKMIQAELYRAFLDQSTTITILAISMIGLLMISRKERSLRSWVQSLVNTEVRQAEAWAETSIEKLVEVSKEELTVWVKSEVLEMRSQLVGDLNKWSENSIVSLQAWMMQNLEQIGAEMVGKPIHELLNSEKFSILGKLSGQVRSDNAVANGVAEAAMPENIKFLRDQLIARVPKLKNTLKNPAQIMKLAQTFGIDLSTLGGDGGEGSNSSGGSWK